MNSRRHSLFYSFFKNKDSSEISVVGVRLRGGDAKIKCILVDPANVHNHIHQWQRVLIQGLLHLLVLAFLCSDCGAAQGKQ